MFAKFMARQLRKPSGLIGEYVSQCMNRSNVAIYHTALEMVTRSNRGRLLEIGFGGGKLLSLAVDSGFFQNIKGIDISLDMVKRVQRNMHQQIRHGRLDVQHGDIVNLPFASSSFDTVISLNTIYFWPSLKTGISECNRVLSNSGELIIGFDDKTEMSKWTGHRYAFTMYEVDEVCAALNIFGFSEIDVVSGKTKKWGLFHCVHARKKTNSLDK